MGESLRHSATAARARSRAAAHCSFRCSASRARCRLCVRAALDRSRSRTMDACRVVLHNDSERMTHS
eukprot:scaffold48056_cov29-Tisochrysis_lutea.AAC.3